MKKLSCIILVFMFSLIAVFPASADSTTAIAKEIIARTNLERQNKGLTLFKTNDTLNSAAQVRAKELAQSFSHTRPNGESCFTVLDQYSIDCYSAGENIGSSTGFGGAETAVETWMNSTGHRNNILNSNYTHIGVGVYKSGNKYYYLQIFLNTDSSSKDYLVGPYTANAATTKTTAKSTTKSTTKTTTKSTTKTTATPTKTTDNTTSTTTEPTTTTTTTTTEVATATTTATQPTSTRSDVNSDGEISTVDARSIAVWFLIAVLLIGAVISIVLICRYRKLKRNR